jgi:hypothetical protein
MNGKNQWIVLVWIMIAALCLTACGQQQAPEKVEPVVLEPLEDGRNLVVLTEKAAKRLDIQTGNVREEQIVQYFTAVGEVVSNASAAGNPNAVVVSVSLGADELSKVNRSAPAIVIPLDADDEPDEGDENGLIGELDEVWGLDDTEDNGYTALHYVIQDEKGGMAPGQRLLVKLAVMSDEAQRLVIPIAALIYDVNGQTWVYISPEPLQFLRFPIIVDYIKDGMVVLLEGPPSGTEVATVGVAELYGADTGVGK